MQPDFPGDAPNGIRLSLDSLVPSPSNLGIILGDVSFIASFDGSVSASVFRELQSSSANISPHQLDPSTARISRSQQCLPESLFPSPASSRNGAIPPASSPSASSSRSSFAARTRSSKSLETRSSAPLSLALPSSGSRMRSRRWYSRWFSLGALCWFQVAAPSLTIRVAQPRIRDHFSGTDSTHVVACHLLTPLLQITLQDLIVSITEPSQGAWPSLLFARPAYPSSSFAAYAALIQNNVTNVVYRNPFGFSLQAIQAGGNFIIDYAGGDAALLTLPVQDSVSAEVSTGNSVRSLLLTRRVDADSRSPQANLVLAIREVAVLSSLNNGGFDAFFTAITNDALVNFDLHGGANGTFNTASSSRAPR